MTDVPIEDRITEVVDGYYSQDWSVPSGDAMRWSPEPPVQPDPAPFRAGGLVRTTGHVDALRYAFGMPDRPDCFVPRRASGSRARALLERALAGWWGSPIADGVDLRITVNTLPFLTALKRAKYFGWGLAWAARPYPLRGAHKPLSSPKPLRAGLVRRRR